MAHALERPARHTVLRSFAGHLDATPDAAFRALEAELAVHRPAVDPAARLVVVQGEWWYRAEYRVRADDDRPGETIVEHEIVNVAERWHRLAPFAGRAELRDAPSAFQRLLTAVQAALAATAEGTDESARGDAEGTDEPACGDADVTDAPGEAGPTDPTDEAGPTA